MKYKSQGWEHNQPPTHPDYGKERTRSCFLFFPMDIRGEGKWLEYVTYIERRGYYI